MGKNLTRERLLQVLRYEPQTGRWTWLLTLSNRAPAGTEAGSAVNGYRTIGIDGVRYQASNLAHLYMTGKWPAQQVDHKNRDSLGDSWDNLRPASNQENSFNRGRYKNSKSGIKGVHWHPGTRKWRVQLRVGDKRIHVGLFVCLGVAGKAYKATAIAHHGEFAMGA